jgi:uncharacterized protein YgiM (DUF1202 family)
MRLIAKGLCALLIAVTLPALAQQAAVEKDSDLRAEASPTAAVVGKVKQGTNGEVTAKSGAWVNFKAPDAGGWLFSFNVKFASTGEGAASSGALGKVYGSSKVQVTSTLGARGFDDEALQNASFNAEQMQLFEQYGVSKDAAADGARTAGLASVRVDYLAAKSP